MPMPFTSPKVLLLVTMVSLLAIPHTQAQPQPTPSPDDRFTTIFDGKTLDGWRAPDMSYWRVEEQAITCELTAEHTPKENSFLVFQGEPVKDFELKFSFL